MATQSPRLRPQGPTQLYPATLATTIHELRGPNVAASFRHRHGHTVPQTASARAHPALPSHPRHYYTRASRPQRSGLIPPPAWRPQGPTQLYPATLATTIHELRGPNVI